MNEAQKFLLSNECDDLRLKDAQKVEDWIYISDMMELYHQAQVKKLTIPVVSNRRELLNALADEFNDSTHTYVGQPLIEKILKAFNCG
jgi:hypothetical protein